MNRGESFAGMSQLTTKSSFIDDGFISSPGGGMTVSFDENVQYDENTGEYESANPYVIYLKSSGKLLIKNLAPKVGGKLVTIYNYPIRSKLWPMNLVDFHFNSGNIALSDTRGQVYKLSMGHLTYESVKLASKAVSAIAFVQYRKNMLAISYENSTNVIINTQTKEILHNIQLPTKSIVRMIRSHPNKPILVLLTEDKKVSLWDIG